MVVNRVDRWTERALALLNSPEGKRLYARNKSEYGLDRRNNICGIIRNACGLLKKEDLGAVYGRVEAGLAVSGEADIRKLRQEAYCFDTDHYGLSFPEDEDDWEDDDDYEDKAPGWLEDYGRQEAESYASGEKAAG